MTLKDNMRYRNWYQISRAAVEVRYHKHADMFCDILAATSPRKQVKANFRVSDRILRQFLDTGTYDRKGLMPVHISNVDRALARQPLSGNKVKRFAMNLKGNLEPVTIDVWMLRWLKEDRTNMTDNQYMVIEARCQVTARKLGLAPAEYQAVAWITERQKYGFLPVSFASVINANQQEFSFMEI